MTISVRVTERWFVAIALLGSINYCVDHGPMNAGVSGVDWWFEVDGSFPSFSAFDVTSASALCFH